MKTKAPARIDVRQQGPFPAPGTGLPKLYLSALLSLLKHSLQAAFHIHPAVGRAFLRRLEKGLAIIAFSPPLFFYFAWPVVFLPLLFLNTSFPLIK